MCKITRWIRISRSCSILNWPWLFVRNSRQQTSSVTYPHARLRVSQSFIQCAQALVFLSISSSSPDPRLRARWYLLSATNDHVGFDFGTCSLSLAVFLLQVSKWTRGFWTRITRSCSCDNAWAKLSLVDLCSIGAWFLHAPLARMAGYYRRCYNVVQPRSPFHSLDSLSLRRFILFCEPRHCRSW